MTDASSEETVCGTIALVGRPNVGKSTLLNAILGEKIAATTRKPQTTRRQLRGIATEDGAQFIFIDTPGLHEKRRGLHAFMVEEALEAARDVDVICFLVEATSHGRKTGAVSIDDRDQQVLADLERQGTLNKPVVLVINNVDLVDDKGALLPLIQEWNEGDRFESIVPLSASKRDGVDVLKAALRGLLPAGPFLFDPDTFTDATERDIAGELIREKAMLELSEELPYKCAVSIEEFDEERRDDPRKPIVEISAVIHVERESQKPMVIGKGGKRIKAIGQRARKDLERLLGCQVFLELFVRVEPKWTETEKGLMKVGLRSSRD